MSLASALRDARTRRGHSQEQAAVYLGTNRNSYAAWEKRDHPIIPPKFQWVGPIAAYCELDAETVALMIVADMRTANILHDDIPIPGYLNRFCEPDRTVAFRPFLRRQPAHAA